MLQDGLCLVLLDRFWHHVENVVHDSRTKLQIVMRFDSLLRDRLGNSFAVTTLELTSQ